MYLAFTEEQTWLSPVTLHEEIRATRGGFPAANSCRAPRVNARRRGGDLDFLPTEERSLKRLRSLVPFKPFRTGCLRQSSHLVARRHTGEHRSDVHREMHAECNNLSSVLLRPSIAGLPLPRPHAPLDVDLAPLVQIL